MIHLDKYTELLQWHNSVELFDYNQTVDWAIELIRNGIETENILIVASFSKPVDRYEIKPYISGVLKDLDLKEKHSQYSIKSHVHYHLQQILEDYDVRKNLKDLYNLALELNNENRFELTTFYLLYHAWADLENVGYNYYFKGANLENIDSILKKEAKNWIDKYIHGIEKKEANTNTTSDELLEEKDKSIWYKIKKYMTK